MSSSEGNDESDEVVEDLEINDQALEHEIEFLEETLGAENCTLVSTKPTTIRLKIFRPYFGDMDNEERGVSALLCVRVPRGVPSIGCRTAPRFDRIQRGRSSIPSEEKLSELEGRPMIMSLHEAALEFLSRVVSSNRDLVMVHILRLACSFTSDLSAGFAQISKELYENGIFTRRALDFAHQQPSAFYETFDRDLSDRKALSGVSLFWRHAGEHSRYASDFEEIERLGSGAYGHVKKCRNKVDGKVYAVKRARIRSDLTVDQVLREVTALATLQHPNVVRYYQAWFETAVSGKLDFSSDSSTADGSVSPPHGSGRPADGNKSPADVSVSPADGSSSPADGSGSPAYGFKSPADGSSSPADGSSSPADGSRSSVDGSSGTKERKIYTYLYIQMEFCPERSLSEYLDSRNGSLEEACAWSISLQIARGLNHIHRNGIIHRDIKPSNIFFNAEKNVKIGDFGLAKFLEVEQLDSAAAGTPSVGTIPYMAPEIPRTTDKNSKAPYDEKADIFSFGVVFFELWSQFGSGGERVKVLSDLKSQEVPSDWAVRFPVQYEILKPLIARAPSDRPSAARVLELLENAAPFDA